METHIKALNLPTWAEMLTACRRPEGATSTSLHTKTIRESDTAPEAQDQWKIENRIHRNTLDDSRFRRIPHIGHLCVSLHMQGSV